MTINDPGGPGVRQLEASLADIVGESRSLRSDLAAAERARKRSTLISTLVLVALAVPMIILLVLVAQTNSISKEVHDTNEVIAGCVNPVGTCAQEGSRRTGEAIGDIIRAEIYMAQCARLWPGEVGPEFDRKLEKCVYDRLAAFAAARAKATTSPSPSPSASR